MRQLGRYLWSWMGACITLLGIWRLAAHHMTRQTENRGFVWRTCLGTYDGEIGSMSNATLLVFYV